MKLYTDDPGKGKKVLCGIVQGKTLYRNIKPTHYMRIVGGYGIQENAFVKVWSRGIKKIILINETNKNRLMSSVEDWLRFGFVKNYGHGRQRFLATKYMRLKTRNGKEQRTLF